MNNILYLLLIITVPRSQYYFYFYDLVINWKKICCSFENLAINYFTLSALHSKDAFPNEQQISGLFAFAFGKGLVLPILLLLLLKTFFPFNFRLHF